MLKVASGVSGASPIWKQIIQWELPKLNKVDFPIPDKIVNMQVDNVSGYAAHDNFPQHGEYFIDGTQPQSSDPIHLWVKVCKDQAGLAPPADVANSNFNYKEYFNYQEDDPASTDGVNRWQQGIDGWVAMQPNQDQYHPPTNFCRNDGTVGASFDSPNDHATVGNDFSVSVSTNSLNKITKVEVFANGISKLIMTSRPFNGNIHLDDGIYDLSATVTDVNGATFNKDIHIGVNKPWDWAPSPTPTMTPVPTPIFTPTLIPSVGITIPFGT
jgi:hypothetical protein